MLPNPPSFSCYSSLHYRTLFELNNEVAIRYTSELQLELFLPQLTEKNRVTLATYGASLAGQWKSVFFTFQDESGTWNLETHFGNETALDPVNHMSNPDVQFPSTINSITIGDGFNGHLQDIQVYVPELATMNTRVVVPQEASFLPQCLCPSGSSTSLGETECTAMDESTIMRYNIIIYAVRSRISHA